MDTTDTGTLPLEQAGAAGAACPKCGFAREEKAEACAACGVIFSRIVPPRAFPAPRPRPREEPEEGAEGAARLRLLGGGLIAAAIALALPFLSFVFSYLVILVHEFGHAATAWVFGYPSVPAFDFVYGGGVTIHEERSWPLLGFVAAGWIGLGYRLRHFRRALGLAAAGAAAFALLALTPAHQVLHIAAGHLAELVFAGIFLYRALSGVSCHGQAERAAYAAAGWFIVLFDIRFAGGLATSAEQRLLYEEAKGGGRWMDLSLLAEQHWNVELAGLALWHLALVFLTPALVCLVWRARFRLARFREWVFQLPAA